MYNMRDLIVRKKRGGALDGAELQWMTEAFTKGQIPDYQMSAMLMAICFTGLSDRETADLTLAMAHSGDMLDLSAIHGFKVDKHSTGGVGDKTTLVTAPLAASLGIPVAKMSGRGLGYTGGTIDKLESIAGFHTSLSEEAFLRNVNTIHLAVASQTANLAPADKKIYALRDVTGTVDQLSLIASSIMSKKLASGADGIVLDVKTGRGAFMKTLEGARSLAREMLSIGRLAGKKMTAVISDMDQPLGFAVGNALEVKEAVETLRGEGPEDLRKLSLVLASHMAVLAGRADSVREAETLLEASLREGQAFETFCRFVKAQGGDLGQVEHPERLPKASFQKEVYADREGFLVFMDTEEIGNLSILLGAGRLRKGDPVDPAVGIVLKKKNGAKVKKGDLLAVVHGNDREKLNLAAGKMGHVFHIRDKSEEVRSLILDVIKEDSRP